MPSTKSAPLRQLLVDPRMKTERLDVLNAIADKLGATASLKSLLRVLDQAERLDILSGVAQSFARLADEAADPHPRHRHYRCRIDGRGTEKASPPR